MARRPSHTLWPCLQEGARHSPFSSVIEMQHQLQAGSFASSSADKIQAHEMVSCSFLPDPEVWSSAISVIHIPQLHVLIHALIKDFLSTYYELGGAYMGPCSPQGLEVSGDKLGWGPPHLSCHSSLCQGSHISCWPLPILLCLSQKVAAQSCMPSSHPWQRQGSAAWSPPWNTFNSVFLLMWPRSALAVLAARSH